MNANHQLVLNEPIANGLDLIGDRWTLLILREAFYGRKRFEDFKDHTGVSRATLSRRLSTLVDRDILTRVANPITGKRLEYHLTETGLSLLGASLLAVQWEADWRDGSLKQNRVVSNMVHRPCQNQLSPQTVCRQCRQVVSYSDLEWVDLQDNIEIQFEEIRACSNKRRKARPLSDLESNNVGLISLVGDRWTMLILIACFFGTRKYDSFSKQLNIPSSILAERLKYLEEANVLKRNCYQTHPPRHEYLLSNKGRSLFPFIMSLRQWVSEQTMGIASVAHLVHKQCGKPFALDVVCGSCKEVPEPFDIEFKHVASP